jgi:predicted flap endonuclease-1-like 5' DNA nuclease
MGLLQKLKSVLGLDSAGVSEGGSGDVGVTVEHEPATESEDAVKGTGDVDSGPRAPQSAPATTESVGESDPAEAEPESAGADKSADAEAAVEAETKAETEDPEAENEAEAAEEADVAEEADAAVESDPVDTINGIGPTYAERLGNAGIETVADLAGADAASVAEAAQAGESRAEAWIDRASER